MRDAKIWSEPQQRTYLAAAGLHQHLQHAFHFVVIAGAPERPLILGEIDHLRFLLVTVPNPGFGKFDALLRDDLRAQAK